ncbi:hypothetical protein ACLB2K_048758 [Fragaria x ananassa]
MFKSARWRSDKNKIKTVFKLQFHATQVPELGVEALMVSVIPVDVGKPTVKLDKAVVRDGSCRWENPVLETVKFDREPRTMKIKERLYNFVLSTGSSKASVLGEVSVDFAEYSEATKATSVSLPLKNSSAVLHVSIQKLQANADQREVEGCEDAKVKSQDNSLKRHLSNNDADESVLVDETITRTTQNAECNRRASIGSDITLSSSDSSSGLDTSRELVLRNINNCHDPSNYLSSPNHPSIPHRPGVYGSTNAEQQQSQWEWSADSEQGVSSDGSTKSSQDTLLREGSLQSSGDEIDKLKTELVVLARQADVSELELQTLRKQIVKESKRGHDLSREVVSLKEERDAFKAECEKLKAFLYRMDDKTKNRFQLEGGDLRALVDEIRQELSCEKDLNINLRLQLQKTHESNAELILAVRDLEELLEQKNGEAVDSNRSESTNHAAGLRASSSNDAENEDEEQKELQDIVKEHSHAKDTHPLEKQITDLYNELEIYKRDKDELEMQMEQLALDYEILKQENHDISYKLEQSTLQEQLKMQYECSSPTASVNELHYQIEDLETELKKQGEDFSNSLATIKELQSHIKSMEEELEKQAQGFEADLETVTCAKIEQEQRAIRAEEALRKTRLKNANTAEGLQEEFRRLSSQMASTFDANEKVAMKAMTEASELGAQKSHLEGMLKKTKEELQASREEYEAKLQKLSNELDEKTREMERMVLEIQNKSMQLEDQQKQEGDFSEVILQLKAEIGRLTTENNSLSEKVEKRNNLSAELEKMKKSIEETEMLIRRGNVERKELVSTIDMLKKEADKSLEKLNEMKYLMDEKESTIRHLQLESDELKAQCCDLKRTLSEDEVEKASLKRQVFDLKADLKKEDALSTIEKKLKDTNGRLIVSDGAKQNLRNNKSLPVPHAAKEVASLRERIKLLEGQIKLKEAALETSTASFLEKEKDLQNVIKELENTVEEINQNSSLEQDIASKDNMLEDVRRASENLSTELASLKERNMSMESELKEMQERYSEISLKFAEVEGERQQLVMTVRNLKNSKRS